MAELRTSLSMCPCEERRMFRSITYPQIRAAAEYCRLCAAFKAAILAVVDGRLPNLYKPPMTGTDRDQVLESITVRPPRLLLDKTEKELSLVIGQEYKTIILFRENLSASKFTLRGYQFPTAYRFGPTTDDARTMDRAAKWLRECEDQHQCNTANLDADRDGFPGRLLDIKENGRIYLINTTGSEQRYACLSYRWGGPPYLLTTVRTIEQHRAGIPYDEFPQTFKDAVCVARRMNISYLWIDALCILQRIKENETEEEKRERVKDFQLENSKMSTIYRKSIFTISADTSTSMTSGIFSQPTDDCKLEVTDDEGKTAPFYIRQETYHWGQPEEVEKRGWTFQEFLLPPRVLHFGRFDVVWRCRKLHTCECGQVTGAAGWRQWLGELAKTVPADDYDAREHWEGIVSNYSRRELGHSEDKLPALSGLAQLFQYERQQQGNEANYLAGLWREWLVQGLCWYSTIDYSYTLRPGPGSRPTWRAPSWSWAAVEFDHDTTTQCRFWARGKHSLHPIHPCGQQRQVCIVEGVECKADGLNPTGKVLPGASIRLAGWPIAAKIKTVTQAKRPLWELTDLADSSTARFCMPDCKDGDGLKDGAEVCCMPILEALSAQKSERGCLVLTRDGSGPYRRVGFCVLMKERKLQEQPQKQPQEKSQEKREADWSQYDFTRPEHADDVRDFALSLDGDTKSIEII